MNYVLEGKLKAKLQNIHTISMKILNAEKEAEKPAVIMTKQTKESADQWRKRCFESIRSEFDLEEKEIKYEDMVGYLTKQKEKVLEKKREQRIEEDLKQCSFKPKIVESRHSKLLN